MKLAIFERSTSATRPDAHVIAVFIDERIVCNYDNHQAQHLMEQVGMILDHGDGDLIVDFGAVSSLRVSQEYAKQLVKDLEFALQEWADYEGS